MKTFTNRQEWEAAVKALPDVTIRALGDAGAMIAERPDPSCRWVVGEPKEVVGLWGWWDLSTWLINRNDDPTGCVIEDDADLEALNDDRDDED